MRIRRSRTWGTSTRGPKRLALLPLLAVLPGCWEGRSEPAPLTVERTSPALGDASRPVLLNDSLTIYFSDAIRPLTVTPDSVTLLDERGHQVAGHLDVGSNWVSFRPDPPMAKDLGDGSFRPGGHYRLQLAGHPRPDSIRGRDGRWLDTAVTFEVFVADVDQAPDGLPSILRPTPSELPFLVRRPEVPLYVASDDPRLQVHFTQPVLPTSLDPEDFQVQVLGSPHDLVPRSVRVVRSPVDDAPGATVELDLGALPRFTDGSQRPLRKGDWIGVALRATSTLTDYAGNRALPSTAMYWSVVEGRSLPIAEWPHSAAGYVDDGGLAPGFEVAAGGIQPRVRVEAGDGRLGAFRPRRDVTLRPGEALADGLLPDGSEFGFTSIEVPEGVTVTIDARAAPVRLRALGGVRVDGALRVLCAPTALPAGTFGKQAVAELAQLPPFAIVAAGDVVLSGEVRCDAAIGEAETCMLVATAASMRLGGALPFQTMLVVEARSGDASSRIEGARGQSRVYPGTFTAGAAPGAEFEVVGLLPWCQLPAHRDSGVVLLTEPSEGLRVDWQATPADPIRGDRPDLSAGRASRWQPARDRDVVSVGAGAFVRFRLQARVRGGSPLPLLERLRLVEGL